MARADSAGSFEAQLPAELESVVAARRMLTAAAKSWGIDESVSGDAALAVSELVTNSVLHAGTPVSVSLQRLGSGVRIEVRDGNRHLPVVDVARPEDLLANRSMTGRGLALVAAMSDRWGAEPVAGGKVTWAEVGTGRRLVASAPVPSFPTPPKAPDITPRARAAGVTTTSAVTGSGRLVHLIGVPVQLLMESTRQLVDMQREMQVMAMDRSSAPEGIGEVMGAGRPWNLDIDHWAAFDRSHAEAALSRGQERIDWDVTVPSDIAERIDGFAAWFRRAASSLIRRHLLSLPASDEVNAYRLWYRDEILAQVGGRPPRPCPLAVPAAAPSPAS